MKLTRHRPDFVLFVVIILLTLIGLVSIFSASSIIALVKYDKSTAYFFIRQLVWVILGLFVMLFTMNIPFTRWQKLSKLFLLGSYVSLILVIIPPFREAINGAHRWLSFGPLNFQPSELAIVAIILYLSYLLSKEIGCKTPRPRFGRRWC